MAKGGSKKLAIDSWQIQQLGEVLQYFRLKKKEVAKKLEALVENDDQVSCMGAVVGKVTSAIFLSDRLDPRDYRHPKCYLKAFGLNLKEKSSGKFKGQLKITKRGSSTARKYLYFACLRLLNNDPIIAQWYQLKVQHYGNKHKMKAITALMRKIVLALWHVGRGEAFDANKLFTLREVVS